MASLPLVILSDLHLTHGGSGKTAEALRKLTLAHAGHEIVLGGDVFGLSSDPKERDPIESVRTLLGGHPELLQALRAHFLSGARVTFIAGNHDAALMRADMRTALLTLLDLNDSAPLSMEPWFIRRGGVHVEHGHVWDPDNAPTHPLALWSSRTEPLGVQLTRRFVARNSVWQFAHAHETTLKTGIQRAFQIFGVRTPLLVARYFATSSWICAETLLPRGVSRERAEGERALASQSALSGLPEPLLRELLTLAPLPTHLQFVDTFFRLYFDRVLSALGLSAGSLWAVARTSPAGAALALASAAYLHWNVRNSGSRYVNLPVRRLRDGAGIVANLTGADWVVFGHTHVPEIDGSYANAGSFGYPESESRRPYLVINPGAAPELRRFAG